VSTPGTRSKSSAKRPARRTAKRSKKRAKKSASKRRLSARQRALLRTKRRRMLRITAVTVGAALAAGALVVLVPAGLAHTPEPVCAQHAQALPDSGVAGWRGAELENAATIVLTGQALGFDEYGQTLAVMTAMGESGLRNIDYGDWETIGFTNPDGSRTTSIGLFQQQAWWGSVEERMDPATAATLFYNRLGRLEGWTQMPPSHAIHRVQINTDPDYYARYLHDATAVVTALAGEC